MTLLVDTSVLVKWFHAEGEGEVDAARSLLSGHRAGTASLGARHGLSFYDAAWAAAARALEVPLVSADRQLLGAGLAVSATEAADRLRG